MLLTKRNDVPVVGLTTGKSITFFTLTLLFFMLATIFVGLRVYARKLKRKSYTGDDYMIFAALVFYIGQTICTIIQIFLGGAGHHVADITAENLAINFKLIIPLSIFYASAMTFIKCSICFMLSSLFFTRSFKIAARLVMGLNVGWGIWAAMETWVVCHPIAYSWDPSIPGGFCLNRVGAYISVGVTDIFLDVCIFILPLPMIWKLKIPLRNKIGLFFVFGVGIISIITSCLRTQSYATVSVADITYAGTFAFLWTQIGTGISCMVACSLILRPVLDKVLPNRLLSDPKSRASKFSRIDDIDYQMDIIANSQPKTTTTVFAHSQPKIPQDGSRQSRDQVERTEEELWERQTENEIKVETEWKISTNA